MRVWDVFLDKMRIKMRKIRILEFTPIPNPPTEKGMKDEDQTQKNEYCKNLKNKQFSRYINIS